MENKNLYISNKARTITPYVSGEQPRDQVYIKLNTNENPYGPSPNVKKALAGQAQTLSLYPDPTCLALREAIAKKHNCNLGEVFVGNGSDEVLALSFQAFFDHDHPILFPQFTYSFYPVYADLYDVPYEVLPMDESLSVDVDGLMGNRAVVLANPNAPTSIALSLEEIRTLCQYLHDRQKLLLVDEAYIDFGGEPADALIHTFDNLLIVRTLSKSHGLAGLRVGYALGQKPLIDALVCIKDSFNSYTLDRFALLGAQAAIEDEAYMQKTCKAIMQTREAFMFELDALGFDTLPSMTNFVFTRHPQKQGGELFAFLKQNGILVRHFDKEGIREYLRISIGTDEQMRRVVSVLKTAFH